MPKAGMKLIPCILKIDKHQPIEVVKAGEEIKRHPTNDELLQLYVEDGFGKGWKKRVLRKNDKKWKNIHKSTLVRVPNDFHKDNIEIQGTPKAVCTVADICHQSSLWQIDKLKKEIEQIDKRDSKLKKTIEDLEKTIEDLRIQLRKTTMK